MLEKTWMMSDEPDDDRDASVLVQTRPKTKRPPLYKVLLLNDDYTPMEFVVHVLERFFGMTHAEAFEIMLTVHKKVWPSSGSSAMKLPRPKLARLWISPAGTSTRCNAPWNAKNKAFCLTLTHICRNCPCPLAWNLHCRTACRCHLPSA